MATEETQNQFEKHFLINRKESNSGPLRKTQFRLREIKQSATPAKLILKSSPKHSDFYSHQQAALKEIKQKDKKMSSTANHFYINISKKILSVDNREATPMRRTFFSKKNSKQESPQASSPPSLLFGRTSLNFCKDIFKNENSNNYLNKYKIIKELGKGSFSTVFLARKQQTTKGNCRSSSPIKLNPQAINIQSNREVLDSSVESPLLNKNDSFHERSAQQENNSQERLPPLGEFQEIQKNETKQTNLVAIKVYEKFKMNKDPHKFKNIRKQINIMQNLDNEGVLKLYESVETLTKISLVVEYGGEESLLEYVKHNYPLQMDAVRDISYQLIKAIAYLHDKSIVHRDIKLQNVLIHQQKTKLIDFGFSCLTHKQQKLTVICGTPNYMAPEVISRKEYFGEQADVWSYGVVVFALAEGRHPFKAETYNELERLVNRGKVQFKRVKEQAFMDFVRRILKVKSGDRPTARQIMEMRWLRQNQG